ncbi:MAG TPA: prepilin-type N-terminal cleavage/methylation domain-containing protein [Thermoanaerobaculia bacterium]|nr:prepilin-type N-terminal cleavage/methylation domain-containing protein [Thermoanaerobaculia bacterium]
MKTRSSQGYSLAEMLIVLSIIGLISLVAVPNFISFQRSAKIKSSLRQLTSDVRSARQRAIAQFRQSKVTFTTGETERSYTVEDNVNGTWTVAPGYPKQLESGVYFYGTTFTDVNSDSKYDVIFLNNGSILPVTPSPPSEYNIVIRTNADIPFNEYKLKFGVAGNFTTIGSKF